MKLKKKDLDEVERVSQKFERPLPFFAFKVGRFLDILTILRQNRQKCEIKTIYFTCDIYKNEAENGQNAQFCQFYV